MRWNVGSGIMLLNGRLASGYTEPLPYVQRKIVSLYPFSALVASSAYCGIASIQKAMYMNGETTTFAHPILDCVLYNLSGFPEHAQRYTPQIRQVGIGVLEDVK